MKNLIGSTFGRLTVKEFAGKKNGHIQWKCVCICGNTTTVYRGNLTSGSTVSCGCHSVEQLVARSTTHGRTNTREFSIWHGMKNRCNNPNADDYRNYGGRGIKICTRWEASFENFFYDMGEAPEGMSIDRVDVDGPYSPENCRWATNTQQANNKRTNRSITVDGTTKNVREWERHLGYKHPVIQQRLHRGWEEVAAVTSPLRT